MLAAYVAAFDFAAELETNRTTRPDFERGKNISPWVLNKRLKSSKRRSIDADKKKKEQQK